MRSHLFFLRDLNVALNLPRILYPIVLPENDQANQNMLY